MPVEEGEVGQILGVEAVVVGVVGVASVFVLRITVLALGVAFIDQLDKFLGVLGWLVVGRFEKEGWPVVGKFLLGAIWA